MARGAADRDRGKNEAGEAEREGEGAGAVPSNGGESGTAAPPLHAQRPDSERTPQAAVALLDYRCRSLLDCTTAAVYVQYFALQFSVLQ